MATLYDPPKTCWSKYASRFNAADLAQMCAWHAIPDTGWNMSYAEFIAARCQLIAGAVRAGYQKLGASE